MRTVESIIGVYLMILVLIGLFTGMYTWLRSSFSHLRDSFNQGLYRISELIYPPALSLDYVNGSLCFKIYTYTPIKLREIVVANANNYEKIYEIDVNRLISGEYIEQLTYDGNELLIYVITDNGVVHYYIPRNDPNLANAPDHIKNKPYIDEELVSYIINRGGGNNSKSFDNEYAMILNHLGYKVFVGGQSDVYFNDVFIKGPLLCGWGSAMYDYCYIGVPYNPVDYGRQARIIEFQTSFFTFNLTTGRCWSMTNDGLITFDITCLSNYMYNNLFGALRYPYIQVFKTVYGRGEIYFTINISFGSFGVLSRFIPVIYVYGHDADIRYPVVLGQPTMNEWPGFRPYVTRILLEESPIGVYNTWYNKTYRITIDTTKYWVHDMYILIGIEASTFTYGFVNTGISIQIT